MRIRSIKPEFYRSADISSLEWEHRLIFVALWSYVDDNGVGIDKLSSITADLFADDLERDATGTFARVSGGLQALSEAGRIVRYEVSGKKYLSVTNWDKHQRIDKPNKERYPRPDAENAVIRDTLATPSLLIRETPAPGTGEQGNRGTEEKTSSKPAASKEIQMAFDAFWRDYPRKVGKELARKAFEKALKKTDARTIMDGLETLRLEVAGKDQQFIPHPTSWLNAGRWEDEAPQQQPRLAVVPQQYGWANQ